LTPIEPPHSSEQRLFLRHRSLLASVATGVSVADTSLFEIDLPPDERIEVSSCDPDRRTTHGLSLQCPLVGVQSSIFLQGIVVRDPPRPTQRQTNRNLHGARTLGPSSLLFSKMRQASDKGLQGVVPGERA
jgi:hypothetical protein